MDKWEKLKAWVEEKVIYSDPKLTEGDNWEEVLNKIMELDKKEHYSALSKKEEDATPPKEERPSHPVMDVASERLEEVTPVYPPMASTRPLAQRVTELEVLVKELTLVASNYLEFDYKVYPLLK